MTVEASVRFWHDEEGWGVLDSPATPGGCWAHFSHIDTDAYRSLTGVATVDLEWEEAAQDGYRFTAVRVRVPGRPPAGPWPERPSSDGAYSSSLTLEFDPGPDEDDPDDRRSGPGIAG